MRKFTVSVFINRSMQDVFDFLSNAENFQRWMPMMQSAAWTPAASLVLGFKILNNVFPLEGTEYVYRLEPEDGGTRLALDGEIELVRFMKFAGGLMGKMNVKSNRNELNTAKQLLEAG